MIDGINDTTALIIGICTATALLAGAYKVLWYGKRNPPRPGLIKGVLLDLRGFKDAILGREPVRDSITGRELAPALPGIGQRMAVQEQQMSEMTRAVAQLAETHVQLIKVDETLLDHDRRLAKLEEAAVERIVTKVESTAAWRAVEAATLAMPDEEPDQT